MVIFVVARAGCSCGVLTGTWCACGALTRIGTFGCMIFNLARTGRSCGVCTGIVLCLRGLGSVMLIINCCDW